MAGTSDLVLTLKPVSRLRVSVRAGNGLPKDNAYVIVKRVAGHAVQQIVMGQTGPDGTVELKVPQEALEIEASDKGTKATATVTVPAEGTELQIAFPSS
jgi:hypothetical protein